MDLSEIARSAAWSLLKHKLPEDSNVKSYFIHNGYIDSVEEELANELTNLADTLYYFADDVVDHVIRKIGEQGL